MEQQLRLPLIGEKAPSFTAESTQGPIAFPADFKGKWVVFFSHPADFTPVCTTEFMMFAALQPQFEKLGCKLVGLSIDSNYSHIAWLRTIKEKIEYRGMKGVEVTFPVISDLTMEVSKAFGMLQPAASTTQAVRAVFIIDPEGTVRSILYYPSATGRNIDEVLRMVTAMQLADRHKVATPANWRPGDEVIVPPPGSCGTARERVEAPTSDARVLDWYITLRKCPE
jgi:peroxiredoxin (alkyl hydroperoxide reductase subunit C)